MDFKTHIDQTSIHAESDLRCLFLHGYDHGFLPQLKVRCVSSFPAGPLFRMTSVRAVCAADLTVYFSSESIGRHCLACRRNFVLLQIAHHIDDPLVHPRSSLSGTARDCLAHVSNNFSRPAHRSACWYCASACQSPCAGPLIEHSPAGSPTHRSFAPLAMSMVWLS